MSAIKLTRLIVVSYLSLFIAQLIWAAATPVIKLTLEFIPPYTFLFLRFLIVGILLLPYSLYLFQKVKVAKQDLFNIFMLGVFSQSGLILFFLGLNYTSTLDTAIIGILGPLLSIAAGHYFYNEKVNTGVKFGVVITLLGTLIVAFEPILTAHTNNIAVSHRLFGNFLIILHNLSFLLFIIWSKISFGQTNKKLKKAMNFIHLKPMTKQYSPSVITTSSFYVGLITMLPFALMENAGFFGTSVSFNLMSLSGKAVLGLLYTAVFSSIVAYYLFEWALKKVTVADTAVAGYLNPVLTIPFSYILLKELPAAFAVTGGLVIAVGVLVTEIALHLHEKRKKSFITTIAPILPHTAPSDQTKFSCVES